MAGDARRRLVAERQAGGRRLVEDQSVAQQLGGEQELGQKAEAGERQAGRRGSDAQAIQGNATGDVQANDDQAKARRADTVIAGYELTRSKRNTMSSKSSRFFVLDVL